MNTANGIKKYYVGFMILGLATIGIAVFVVMQGLSGKQDTTTHKRANEIARDLNKYVDKQRKIPESLEEAGIDDVPKTIKYTKKDSSSYEFCVTYKAAKSYGSSDLTSVLWGSALREASYQENDLDSSSSYKPSSLYLSYSYKKGENCQTVEPYYLGSSRSNYFDPYGYADPQTSTGTNPNSSAISIRARDTERQTDIKALHGQIEAYYAQNGRYPTLANMNSPTFRSANLKGLDTEALKDPAGKVATLLTKATKNYYSYTVTSNSGGACDNSTSYCAKYVLTATLEQGGTYTKLQLN